MEISDENQTHFSIYRTEVGPYAIRDALTDKQLFDLCRDQGDYCATLKSMVFHTCAAVHKWIYPTLRSCTPPRSLTSTSERYLKRAELVMILRFLTTALMHPRDPN